MTAASFLSTPPPVWLALGCIPVVILTRRLADVGWLLLIVVLAAVSIDGARFSPYNRLDLVHESTPAGPRLVLAANRDFHQFLFDLSDRALTATNLTPAQRVQLRSIRATYDLPFQLTQEKRDALVVGAGTGNDVAAALRNGFGAVTSIDIDPVIIGIGRSTHPEHPYSDPRVTPVVNDARNFFETWSGHQYDVVCFGLLDSHAMFSAMSTLRLDNYVYTTDGLRAAWRQVRPGGVMSITFQVWQGEWIAERISRSLELATGTKPVVVGGEARTFLVAKGVDLRQLLAVAHVPIRPSEDFSSVHATSDDWPFLYLRPGVFPFGYAAVLSIIIIIAVISIRYAYGQQTFTRGRFDLVLFLMGAAFLLIETRGVTDLSLLFGSTWLVNSAVFGGVLLVAWMGNRWVIRHGALRCELWFVPLFLALLISYWVRPTLLLQLPFLIGGMSGAILNALPIGFAAIIFSSILKSSPDPAAGLGSNLLGAVVGGCLEYVSLYSGLRSVTLIALALYLTALLLIRRGAIGASL